MFDIGYSRHSLMDINHGGKQKIGKINSSSEDADVQPIQEDGNEHVTSRTC